MTVNNPITIFCNSNTEKKFTYEGGNTLYHFSPQANGLSKNMDNNLVFWANDPIHAKDVLKRMIEFVIDVKFERILNHLSDGRRAHRTYLLSCSAKTIQKFSSYLQALDNNQIELSIVPTNQFMKVSWASNDTVS